MPMGIAPTSHLQVKHLLELVHGVLRAIDSVSNGAGVFINLIVVTSNESLVTEEVDGAVFDARDALLRLDVLQAVGLVPTGGEDIKGDLATDGVSVILVLAVLLK
jgi:hypothetical protein